MDHPAGMENQMRKPEISEQLINYLEERLLAGEYRPGMRIPSVRRLAAKFCLSYGSAIRGIDFLCEQGKLEKASKRGIYVCRQETPLLIGGGSGGKKIVFFIGSELDADCQSLWYTALLGFSQSASKRGDCIVMTPLPHDSDCNRVLRENAREADGLVIFNSFYWPLEPLPAGSAAVGALFDGNLDGTLSVVNLDALDAARQAVEYFRLKRVRHVVITSSSRKLFMTRGRLFAALWRSEGGSCVFSDGIPPEFDPANGYLFTSDQVCQQACEAAAETGAKPPFEYVPMLSIDGKRLLRADFFRFPTLAIDWRLLGQCLYRELCTRMENPAEPVKNINLCGRLAV